LNHICKKSRYLSELFNKFVNQSIDKIYVMIKRINLKRWIKYIIYVIILFGVFGYISISIGLLGFVDEHKQFGIMLLTA